MISLSSNIILRGMGTKEVSSLLVISCARFRFLLTKPATRTYSYEKMEFKVNTTKITEIKQEMFSFYRSAVSAVMPENLVSQVIRQYDDHNFLINDKIYHLNKNVYVVGFGKAVIGMAIQIKKMMGVHIVRGILSVPVGAANSHEVEEIRKQHFEVCEGAAGNLPDTNAETTAKHISTLAQSLQEGTILMVLISGGGSALLPAPISGITVQDKAKLIYQLQSKGALIQEINSVRKKLSLLKGGKLAVKAYPAHVITFILSDVIGDPLHFIASGPTVEDTDPPNLAFELVKKYGLENEIQNVMLQALTNTEHLTNFPHDNVFNILIGSNKTALQAVQEVAVKANYLTLLLSDKINSSVTDLSEWYSAFCIMFCNAQKSNTFEELNKFLQSTVTKYNFSSDIVKIIIDFAHKFKDDSVKGLCVIGGGEPTVTIRKGCCNKGGRSQELALRFSIKMHESSQKMFGDISCILMAAGTDGIDGPTDVAGAFGYLDQVHQTSKLGINAQKFVEESNSYGYFSFIPDDLIKVGHTGTNVMDLHVLLLQKL